MPLRMTSNQHVLSTKTSAEISSIVVIRILSHTSCVAQNMIIQLENTHAGFAGLMILIVRAAHIRESTKRQGTLEHC